MKTTQRPVKLGGYSHAVQDAKLAQRRREAEERQVRYDRLGIVDKLNRCENRPGESKREKARRAEKLTA